jgi:hypothetical protein
VNVALPRIGSDLHAGLARLHWASNDGVLVPGEAILAAQRL